VQQLPSAIKVIRNAQPELIEILGAAQRPGRCVLGTGRVAHAAVVQLAPFAFASAAMINDQAVFGPAGVAVNVGAEQERRRWFLRFVLPIVSHP
jgi:hypothetical protein